LPGDLSPEDSSLGDSSEEHQTAKHTSADVLSAEDLVALKADPYQEFVSRFIARKLLHKKLGVFGRLLGRSRSRIAGIDRFSSHRIKIVGSMLIASFASLFLVTNAVALYYARSIEDKLGIIAALSWLHATFVSVFQAGAVEAVTSISA